MPVVKNKKLPKTPGKQYAEQNDIARQNTVPWYVSISSIVSLVVSIVALLLSVFGFFYKFGKLEQEFRDKIEFNQESIVEVKTDFKEFKKEHKEDLKELRYNNKTK